MLQARASLIASLALRAQRAEEEQGRRIAEARAAERVRIAREMHDVLAHRLSLVATYAGALEYRPDATPEQRVQAALTSTTGIMTPPVRVAIVDDDALVLAGLIMMLDGVDGIAIVGEAADSDQVMGLVDAHSPDVILMNIRMPKVDGITATARVGRRPSPA
jgi:PleD family two-component response regulator